MTIDEAIEELTLEYKQNSKRWTDKRCLAHRIGIEALEELKRSRSIMARSTYILLPGETED